MMAFNRAFSARRQVVVRCCQGVDAQILVLLQCFPDRRVRCDGLIRIRHLVQCLANRSQNLCGKAMHGLLNRLLRVAEFYFKVD